MKIKRIHGTIAIAQLLLDRMIAPRQSQHELAKRYRAVIHQASEGIFLVDEKSERVLEANAAFHSMFGYDTADIPQLRLGDLIVNREMSSSVPGTIDIAGLIGEKRCRRKDGTEFDAETSADIITNHKGRVISVVTHDVTQRKRAILEIGRLLDQEQSRRQELEGLYNLSRSLADTADAETLLNLVASHAASQVHAAFARILVLDNNELYVHSTYSVRVLDYDLHAGKRALVSSLPLYQRIVASPTPLIVHHMDRTLTGTERELFALDIAHSLCATPMRVDDRVLGILTFGDMRRPPRVQFTNEKLILIRSIADQAASALRRTQLFAELETTYLQTVLALARAVDAKDTCTRDHSDRLALMAVQIGKTLGIKGRELEDLRFGAILHDIGKIGVPDWILLKPAPLTDEEWRAMRQHPVIGAQILTPVPHLAGAAKIVRHHHERFDGHGYPDQLAGDAIPLGARILTVVDSFSAMIERRVYKEPRPPAQAINELLQNAGTQFDPRIVQLFIELFPLSQVSDERTANALLIPSPVHDLPAPQPGIVAAIPVSQELQPTEDSLPSAA